MPISISIYSYTFFPNEFYSFEFIAHQQRQAVSANPGSRQQIGNLFDRMEFSPSFFIFI